WLCQASLICIYGEREVLRYLGGFKIVESDIGYVAVSEDFADHQCKVVGGFAESVNLYSRVSFPVLATGKTVDEVQEQVIKENFGVFRVKSFLAEGFKPVQFVVLRSYDSLNEAVTIGKHAGQVRAFSSQFSMAVLWGGGNTK